MISQSEHSSSSTGVGATNDQGPKCMLLHVFLAGHGWPSRSQRLNSESSIWYLFSTLSSLRELGLISITRYYFLSSLATCVRTGLTSTVGIWFVSDIVSYICAALMCVCPSGQCSHAVWELPQQFGVCMPLRFSTLTVPFQPVHQFRAPIWELHERRFFVVTGTAGRCGIVIWFHLLQFDHLLPRVQVSRRVRSSAIPVPGCSSVCILCRRHQARRTHHSLFIRSTFSINVEAVLLVLWGRLSYRTGRILGATLQSTCAGRFLGFCARIATIYRLT